MNFLAIFFIIIIAFWLFFRLFGRQIIKLALKYFVKKAAQNMAGESRAFYENYGNTSPYQEDVYVDNEIRVTKQKRKSEKKPVRFSDVEAEEVEFEEIDQ